MRTVRLTTKSNVAQLSLSCLSCRSRNMRFSSLSNRHANGPRETRHGLRLLFLVRFSHVKRNTMQFARHRGRVSTNSFLSKDGRSKKIVVFFPGNHQEYDVSLTLHSTTLSCCCWLGSLSYSKDGPSPLVKDETRPWSQCNVYLHSSSGSGLGRSGH